MFGCVESLPSKLELVPCLTWDINRFSVPSKLWNFGLIAGIFVYGMYVLVAQLSFTERLSDSGVTFNEEV